MGPAATRRGRPVAFFATLLAAWVGLRVVTFEPLIPAVADVKPQMSRASAIARVDAFPVPSRPAVAFPARARASAVLAPVVLPSVERPILPPTVAPAEPPPPFAAGRFAAAHNIAFMAAMARLPLPSSVADAIDRAKKAEVAHTPVKHWRFDGWLVLRSGGTSVAPGGARPPSYGASQAGVLLSYQLAPASALRPSAYARASHALVAGGETEAALGLNFRPIDALPVTAHAEMRVTRRAGGTELRPAAFLAGGFDGMRLPLGLSARGYGQAGYVSGTFETAFADGQVVVEQEVKRFDLGRISAGAGAWAGVQKGASRFDVGPAASVELAIGDAPVRLSVDYRQRITGDAAPASGAALTLSTGF